MPAIHPFRALRPAAGRATEVASPPYDVVSTEEAVALCEASPHCFLRVVRPEVDLPAGADAHSAEAYEVGKGNLLRLHREGVLVREEAPALYVYRLTVGGHVQTGVVGLAEVADYRSNRIRKHEHTRPDKERDRADHIEHLGAQCGPVFLLCPTSAALSRWLEDASRGAPLHDFEASDGVRHTVWAVSDPEQSARGTALFAAMDRLYVADGHHRSAAASVVHGRHVERYPGHPVDAPCARFLAVTFPEDQVRILPYNRAVRDLGGLTAAGVLERVSEAYSVAPCPGAPGPTAAGAVDVYLDGSWHRLTARPGVVPDDPVAGLDVAVLQDRLLGPVLGVGDPRTDERIAFVGGIRGTGELERLVDSGRFAIAFSLCATPVPALLRVADSGNVMPPKSTWFEPKLRSGLFVQVLGCTPAGEAY